MYTSVMRNPRAQTAVLNALFPGWDDALFVLSYAEWVEAWMIATGISFSSAKRWRAIAMELCAKQIAAAA